MRRSLSLAAIACAITIGHAQPLINQSWLKNVDGPWGNNYFTALAADGGTLYAYSGNSYVTGPSYRPGYGYDFLTAAYSPMGAQLWARRYDLASVNDWPTAIVSDKDRVYVAGYSTFNYGLEQSLVAYDYQGNTLWTYHDGAGEGHSSLRPIGVGVGGTRKVTVVSQMSSGTHSKWYTITFDPENSNSAPWSRIYDQAGVGNTVKAMAVEPETGKIFVVGSSVNVFGESATIVAYDQNGNLLYETHYSSPSGGGKAQFTAVASAGQGVAFAAGYETLPNGHTSMLLVRVSATGNKDWTHVFTDANGGDSFANSIAYARGAAVFAGGKTSPTSLPATGIVLRCNFDGTNFNSFEFGNGKKSEVLGLASDLTGRFVAVGDGLNSDGIQEGFAWPVDDVNAHFLPPIEFPHAISMSGVAMDLNGRLWVAGADHVSNYPYQAFLTGMYVEAAIPAPLTFYTGENVQLHVGFSQGPVQWGRYVSYVQLVSQPGHGNVVFNTDGSFVYTPNTNFFGTDLIYYYPYSYDGSIGAEGGVITIYVPSTIKKVAASPKEVAQGDVLTGTVTLDVIPTKNYSVALSLSPAAAGTVSSPLMIPTGSQSKNFNITAGTVSVPTTVTVKATLDGATVSDTFVVDTDALASIGVPTSVVGGNTATCTCNLTGLAVAAGQTVHLSSSSPFVTVPLTAIVPHDKSSVQFMVPTQHVTSPQKAVIQGVLGSVTVYATLNISP